MGTNKCNPEWIPPLEYREALARDVLPHYREVRRVLRPLAMRRQYYRTVDNRVAGDGLDHSKGRIERGEEMNLLPPSPPYYLLHLGSYEPHDPDVDSDGDQRPPLPRKVHPRLFPETFWDLRVTPALRISPSLWTLQDAFWDSLVGVLEETRILDAAGAPGLSVLLDATVRTLEMWAREFDMDDDLSLWWHPPSHPWPDPDDDRREHDPRLPLPERVKATLDRNRAAWSRLRFQLPTGEKDLVVEIQRRIGPLDSFQERLLWRVVEEIGYRTARFLVAYREYRMHPELRHLSKLRKTFERLGEELFSQPMPSDIRWQMKTVMTGCLALLRDADKMRGNAARLLESVGYNAPDDLEPVRYLPDGTSGHPGQLRWGLAEFVYEEVYRHRAAEAGEDWPRLGLGTPFREILDETAKLLSWAFLPEDLETHANSKLYKRIRDKLY